MNWGYASGELSSLYAFSSNTRYLSRRWVGGRRHREGGKEGRREGGLFMDNSAISEHLKGVVCSTLFQPISVLLCFSSVSYCDVCFQI